MTPVVIDCDPGHDDAIALLLALASPEIHLLGVTTVAGNTTVDKTTRNALTVLDLAGRTEVPVAVGAAGPRRRSLHVAEHVHGASGLDGPAVPRSSRSPDARSAVDLLRDLIVGSDRPVTLVPVGPLTNIALLIERHPEVLVNVDRIVSMGGSIGLGNITPAAEFNIYVDPEAAAIVYRAGVPLTMVGLDVTHRARLGPEHADRLRDHGVCGRFVAELLDFFISNYRRRMGFEAAPIHDALAVAHVVWTDLVTTDRLPVEIDTSDGPSAGRTLVDRYRVTGAPDTVDVAVDVDGAVFAERLVERLLRLP